jgi:hypothetical protein
MENFLWILPLLACPLAMAAMAGGAWIWARARAVPGRLRERQPDCEPPVLRRGDA